MQEVKKPARSKNFYFYLYEQIKQGYTIPQVIKKTSKSKQSVNYYLSVLKRLNVINKVSYAQWEVLKNINEKELEKLLNQKKSKHFSIGTSERPKTHLHALQIKFPILKGTIKDHSWKIKEKLRNWTPKYTQIQELGGLTIKNNNNKSLIVWAESREVKNTDEVRKLVMSIMQYIQAYFKVKHNVLLDTINAEVKNLDIATEDKHAEEKRGKGDKLVVDLKKSCEKILKGDNRNAYAWIDGTPYKFSAETNDLEWKKEYLNMPFRLKDLAEAMYLIETYNENLKLHTKVQQEQLRTQKEIQKLLEKLNNTKSI